MKKSAKKPSVLSQLWDGWKTIAAVIGTFQSRLLFSIIYFLVGLPFSFIVRRNIKPFKTARDTAWHPVEVEKDTVTGLRKQN